jgi:hypothetical protein
MGVALNLPLALPLPALQQVADTQLCELHSRFDISCQAIGLGTAMPERFRQNLVWSG